MKLVALEVSTLIQIKELPRTFRIRLASVRSYGWMGQWARNQRALGQAPDPSPPHTYIAMTDMTSDEICKHCYHWSDPGPEEGLSHEQFGTCSVKGIITYWEEMCEAFVARKSVSVVQPGKPNWRAIEKCGRPGE